ncbi:hypothetical protein BU26DRAFT_550497 [Trematosphaeria pertusa]|uniref:Uncharacterized protein n=1 Tax=Trematosphaeria pertusa TaxID=390896 RepID=A0A6A6IIU5_9PLEO|nr:uncharacterized protein BU26DRAFT_550497 [Trematosphaeria pertusa]KAF2250331.1 hypothetical protein BU26DRAFT_550497 [Trematosphaeria pertusa]
MTSDQNEPLLAQYGSDDEGLEHKFPRAWEPSLLESRWRQNIAVHGTLILLYTVISAMVVYRYTSLPDASSSCIRSNTIPIPFTTHPVTFHNLSQTRYAGDKPKQDLDAAWEDLLRPMNMRFTKEELESANQHSVALPEGGGYLRWFGVFHVLHCTVRPSAQVTPVE